MGINLQLPGLTELRPRITVIGVGGAGGNAVNNMVEAGLEGVEFIAANTDAQALASSGAYTTIQMGVGITEGLGAGSRPEIGAAAAEEAIEEIRSHLDGVHLLFITAGMGGGTGTGAAPIIARTAKELGVLTVAVVTKPFEFEGQRRMRTADVGIAGLAQHVDTLIVIPNQNLFLVASERTTFADAFSRADDVLRSGVSCITDLMVKEGLINLDFADVRTVMQNMGTALMGTGEAEGEKRALQAAEAAISNPLLGEVSMRGAKGLLVSITGSFDMTLYEVEEAASRIRREVDPEENPDVNIIVGATFDQSLQNRLRVSVVATGIQSGVASQHIAPPPPVDKDAGLAERMQSVQQEAPRRAPFGGLREQPARQAPDRRVVLEPKGRRGPDDGAPPVSADNGQRFEPMPPAKTARAPRRPLTFSDFPELGQADSGGNNAASNRSSGKPRGFFDWMAGRDRNASKASPPSQTKSVALQPRSNHEKSVAEQGHRNGASHDDAGEDLEGDPAAARQNSDEAIEIPKFFRKPTS
ncbi:cell division protein FtsZ [Rhodomicrobium sp. Az07]|uniref:cell division protein FtsZ n=1 Tax=Rhodomicrobium sp. Az07 TaxID=2839034 RepID=UPI001BE7BCBC|nr:cell division protein FtsZ [Rhodomicrobium sp. Az07]MBT3071732.1 cell division protein FtsZ [Rhodomicrobium sp. Az07]